MNLQHASVGQAIVLAAGRGKRLRPHTDSIPKPLLPVAGKPMLHYTLTALSHAGVGDVCLVTNYREEDIFDFVGDGTTWNLRVTFRHQAILNGTAAGLRAAAPWLIGDAFVLAADYVLAEDALLPLLQERVERGSDIVAWLRQVPSAEVDRRSQVRFGKDARIVEIVEKPGEALSGIGASLIYIVPAKIKEYVTRVEHSDRGEYEIQSVINLMLKDGYCLTGPILAAPAEWQPEL